MASTVARTGTRHQRGEVTAGMRPSRSSTSLTGKRRIRVIPEPDFQNPYRHELHWTENKRVKLILGAIFLFPLRLMTLLFLTFWVYVVCVPATWGLGSSPTSHLKPLQQILVRNVLRGIIGRLIAPVLGFYHPKITGTRASHRDAPFTVVAPHTSLFDVIMSGVYTPGSYVSLLHMRGLPLVGTLMSVAEMVWVERDAERGVDASSTSSRQAIEERLNSPKRWQSIVVFPEGTVHAPGVLINFRPGLFLHGVPVQPVVFRFNASAEWTTWTDPDHSLWMSVFHTLCQFENEFEVEYLPVYTPNMEEKANPILYAHNVRQVFANALKVPCTEHSCEDTLLTEYATKLGLPLSAGCIEFRRLREDFGMLSYRLVKRLLKHFSKLDSDKDGFVTERDMCVGVPWPFPADVKKWFADFDTSGRGRASFREYVIAYAEVVHHLALDTELLQRAFEALSEDPSRALHQTSPRCITLVSVKSFFSRQGGYVPGTHIGFHGTLCPDRQPCGLDVQICT
eukprot:scpid71029/ scgid6189/ Lysophosphatidylcholine acyltransferase 1; 1-acylglycerophosphocholine O-acyltransferase; 1-alkylglycerophosphocholine O-acetyltransferase; Acetyl-CoA:lyso-platelet-activating factor acetyltransferase; Acyltransferase-like 2